MLLSLCVAQPGPCSSRGHTHRHKLVVLQLDDVSDADVHPLLLPEAAEGQRSGVRREPVALLLPCPTALCPCLQPSAASRRAPCPLPGYPGPTTLTLRRSAPETAGCSPGCRFYGGTGCGGEETAASAPLETGSCIPPPANATAPGTAHPHQGHSPLPSQQRAAGPGRGTCGGPLT